jgi:SH3-like domain-containing protein
VLKLQQQNQPPRQQLQRSNSKGQGLNPALFFFIHFLPSLNMKILKSIYLIFFLLVSPAILLAEEKFPFLAEVSKESVNVRAGANTNYEKVDKLPRGSEVVVVGRTYEWFKIQLPLTAKAYIRSDYLDLKDGLIAQLKGNNVNVRAAASSEAASLGQLKADTIVKVIEQTNGWCRIEPLGQTFGFIHQDFLAKKSDQVPANMWIAPIKISAPGSSSLPIPKEEAVVLPKAMHVKGRVILIEAPTTPGVHYALDVNGKTAYYLKDIPNMAPFVNTTVDIDAFSVDGNQLAYPLLFITKIKLIL